MNHQLMPKFTVLPKSSVGLYAESVGHPNLSDEALSSLSEDVTYRIRETTNCAVQFMRHSKRRYLTTDDFNNALKWSHCQAICGQGGVDVPNFRPFNFKDSSLSYTEDKDANLRETAFDSTLPADPGEVSVKAQWLVFEGHNCSGGKQTKDEIGHREVLEEPFASYLESIISAVFGSNANARMVAIENIRTSGKLQSVLPYLVTFLASQVKSCSGNDTLKSIVSGVLFVVHALVENNLLFILPYVLQLVKLLLFIITDENLPVDFWPCKLRAARILTQLCRHHMASMNYLPHNLLKAYQETLNDDTKPLASTFGAAYGIACLGSEPAHQIAYLTLLKKVDSIKEKVNTARNIKTIKESLLVFELFQGIALFLLRSAGSSVFNNTWLKAIRSSGALSSSSAPLPSHKYLSIYDEVLDYFVDGVVSNTQYSNASATNLRSIFNPCKAASSKPVDSKSNGTTTVQNLCPMKCDSLKSEKPLQHLSKAEFVKTSLGIVKIEFKWKKRRLGKRVTVFDDSDGVCLGSDLEGDMNGREKFKGRRFSNEMSQESCNVKRTSSEKPFKFIRRCNKATRLRLTDLARISTTTYIVI